MVAATPTDQFFAGGVAFNNDDPNRYIGRSPLDRTNELSFGGSLAVKYGLQVAMIGHFFLRARSVTHSRLALWKYGSDLPDRCGR